MTMDLTKFPRGARSGKQAVLTWNAENRWICPNDELIQTKANKRLVALYAKDENDELTLQVRSLKPYLIMLTMISQGQSWGWADIDDCWGSREKSCWLWKVWPKWSWEANIAVRAKSRMRDTICVILYNTKYHVSVIVSRRRDTLWN